MNYLTKKGKAPKSYLTYTCLKYYFIIKEHKSELGL